MNEIAASGITPDRPFAPNQPSLFQVLDGRTQRSIGNPGAQARHAGRAMYLDMVQNEFAVLRSNTAGSICWSCLDTLLGKDLADATLMPFRALCRVDTFSRQLTACFAHTEPLGVQFAHTFFRGHRQLGIPARGLAPIEAMGLQMAATAQWHGLGAASIPRDDMMVLDRGLSAFKAGGIDLHPHYIVERPLINLSFAETGHGNAYA